jgi:CRP-like cAMP-binding protein
MRETTVTSNQNPLAQLLRKLETHAVLGEEDRQAILALPYTLKTLEPHAYIVREGDRPDVTAILASGFALRQKLTGEGTRQIVALHIPGESLDFQNLFLDTADHNLQALTRIQVALVPRSEVQNLVQARPAVARAISVHILVEASIFREWILNVGRRQARGRVAHLLCELAVRLEAQGLTQDYGYELPMTQEQLSDAVGLTPVHVNRTLKQLELEGYLTREKRRVSFPDWRRLREVGDFNQSYLHLQPQQAAGR